MWDDTSEPLHFTVFFMFVKEQNSKHLDEHRETDEMSEKTSPNKNLKSPQKGSKRLKTVPFKMSLLDTTDFEGEIEVCWTFKGFVEIHFLDLALKCWTNWKAALFILPVLLFSCVGSCVCVVTVLHRMHKTGRENKRIKDGVPCCELCRGVEPRKCRTFLYNVM